jgi:hypothetical protein
MNRTSTHLYGAAQLGATVVTYDDGQRVSRSKFTVERSRQHDVGKPRATVDDVERLIVISGNDVELQSGVIVRVVGVAGT